MWRAFVDLVRDHPEIGIFASLGFGYLIGNFQLGKFSLGPVTGTLIAAVVIGQLDLTIDPLVKSVFFLLFIFSVGYWVGPQFIHGFRSSGLPEIGYAVVQAFLSLASVLVAAKIAGLDAGYGSGLLAGSQTLSASLGMASDALKETTLSSDEIKTANDHMPIAYAVTYIFGTVGSAWVLAYGASRLVSKDLVKDAAELEAQMSISPPEPEGVESSWHEFEVRAFRVPAGSRVDGLRIADAEQLEPAARLFVERVRRDGKILDPDQDMVLRAGDVVAVGGHRQMLARYLNNRHYEEIDDHSLLDLPIETVDVVVTRKDAVGKSIGELLLNRRARGVYLAKVTHGPVELPNLPGTVLHKGDTLTITGRQRHVDHVADRLGYADRPNDATDMTWVGLAVAAGATVGALVWKIGDVPLTLSTTGGALVGGILLGWLRSVHHTFGRVPAATLWFMRSVGLNVFLAVVGISAGPSFVDGLKDSGVTLFLWGVFATTTPLVLGTLIGRYVFKFHPAIVLGSVAGARTSTPSLSLIQDVAKSQTPALGYTVPYAVGNTLLTVWGMVIVILLA